VKGTQFLAPLFEFSGACAGCGETPYLKLLTQLFGDRLVIANATGCSSIYGGNLPTTPYCANGDGRGPAWANSLFEDNAEFGLGSTWPWSSGCATPAPGAPRDAACRPAQGRDPRRRPVDRGRNRRAAGRVAALREILRGLDGADAPAGSRRLADDLVKKSVWIVGGDGWAYDIGYGGLDHVLASGANVKVLVLDTEVYSNTGGQASKATPMGAVAKFAAGGKSMAKKDLALIAMQYGHVYVAQVAFGAKDSQTVAAFREAEAYNGPALIIAYSHCIAHGFPLHLGLEQQKLAVDSGYWPLFRYDPRLLGTRRAHEARLRGAQDRPRQVHRQRDPLQHAQERRARPGCGAHGDRAGAGAPALRPVQAARRQRGVQRRRPCRRPGHAPGSGGANRTPTGQPPAATPSAPRT
jgi:pyruvate-ferredoxin/flavodoxin oxidoreductase